MASYHYSIPHLVLHEHFGFLYREDFYYKQIDLMLQRFMYIMSQWYFYEHHYGIVHMNIQRFLYVYGILRKTIAKTYWKYSCRVLHLCTVYSMYPCQNLFRTIVLEELCFTNGLHTLSRIANFYLPKKKQIKKQVLWHKYTFLASQLPPLEIFSTYSKSLQITNLKYVMPVIDFLPAINKENDGLTKRKLKIEM